MSPGPNNSLIFQFPPFCCEETRWLGIFLIMPISSISCKALMYNCDQIVFCCTILIDNRLLLYNVHHHQKQANCTNVCLVSENVPLQILFSIFKFDLTLRAAGTVSHPLEKALPWLVGTCSYCSYRCKYKLVTLY